MSQTKLTVNLLRDRAVDKIKNTIEGYELSESTEYDKRDVLNDLWMMIDDIHTDFDLIKEELDNGRISD